MNITFFVRRCDRKGGISRYVLELAEEFYKNVNQVEIYANSLDDIKIPGIKLTRVPMLSSVLLKKHKFHAVNNIFELTTYNIFSHLLAKKNNIRLCSDIIHTQGEYDGICDVYTAHSCHKAWLYKFRAGNTSLLENLKKSRFNPLHSIMLASEKKCLEKARYIIAISRAVKQELIDYYHLPEEKIEVIYNGVDIETFNPEHPQKNNWRKEIRKKFNIPEGDFVIIFPAHEFHRKGLNEILEVMQIVAEPHIHLLVTGKDNPTPYLEKINDYNLKEKVHFAGAVSEIEKYYLASDIMVFPTDYEPFGLVILEAMASGLPVITTSCAGAAELIEDGINGFLLNDRTETEKIAAMLKNLLLDRQKISDVGSAARKTAKEYSWRKTAELTYNIYKKAIAEKSSSVVKSTSLSQKKTKIIMFTRSLYTHSIGGMEIHIDNLTRELAAIGYDITIITTAHPQGITFEEKNGIKIYYIAGTKPGKYSVSWRIKSRSLFYHLHKKERFNILHSQSAGAFHLINKKQYRLLHIPTVVSLHGTSLDEIKTRLRLGPPNPRITAGLLKNLLNYFFDKIIIPHFDMVIATSDSQKKLLNKYYNVPSEKLRLVYNGIDDNFFRRANKNPKLLYSIIAGASKSATIIMTAARLKKEKGIQNLIAAFPDIANEFPDAHLVILGDGEYRQPLEKLARVVMRDYPQTSEKIHFTGNIPYEKLPEYLNLADVFVNPTLRENGYDLVILQAMACEKPVISSDIKSVTSTVITDGKNGFIYPKKDIKALAETVKTTLKDKTLARQISHSARQTIEKKFSAKAMALATARIYEDLLNRR